MRVLRKKYKNGFFVDLPEYYAEFANNGWYENSEIRTQDWIIDHFQRGWYSLDVGAHIGYYSMLMSFMSRGGGRVFAFEVCEPTIKMMRRNIAYNEVHNGQNFDNIYIVQTALGDKRGVFKEVVRQTGITEGNYGETYGEFAFDTLDNFVQDTKMPRLDFIKIDTDGWDFDVICGAENTLKYFRPFFVMETNDLHTRHHNADQLIAYLNDLNYAFEQYDLINWLCTPREKR